MPKTRRKITFQDIKRPIPITVTDVIPININGVQRILTPGSVQAVTGEELEVLDHSSYSGLVRVLVEGW